MGKLDREKYVLERAPESNTSLAHTVQRSIVCLSVHGEFSVPLLLYESADDRWTMRHWKVAGFRHNAVVLRVSRA